jgi:hypothetical protein
MFFSKTLLRKILCEIQFLHEKVDKMTTTLAQLDAAIAAENTSIASLVALATKLDTDVTALVAKVNTGADFTAELNAVQANAGLLSTATTNVQSADTASGG